IMKKRVHYFLKHDLVHIVASDMHNLDTRPPYMAEAYEIISKRYGKEKAEVFFIKNPLRILMDLLF
ncbi:CpsB/CapC family capsule biosynthesis tyrosine phosphatase, partial [Streptococcus pneumoniae]|uniref:CpsB/CapC family capsule biosynthesis tyrosine phosphatase n=1 Tax=Streptococcus pneumoniae TaxID=1313 RepID=UPI002E7BF86C